MIIKFTIPVNYGNYIQQLHQNTKLLLQLTNYKLIIDEITYFDKAYTGISILTNKNRVIFNYFSLLAELPCPELEDYMLRLLAIAIEFVSIYETSLSELDLAVVKHFKRLHTILIFLKKQIMLVNNSIT